MMRRLVFLLAVILLAGSSAHAAVAGATGAGFLEIGVGARAAAMGEANVAWADDVYGLYFNPAGVARASRKEIGFVHNNLFQDLSYNYLGYIHPVSFGGTFGANVTYVDLGDARRTTYSSSATNAYLGSFSSYDVAGSLTYARPLRSFLDVGGSIKVINERLDQYTATAVAVDLGLVLRPPVQGLSFGVALSNLGSSLKFVRENDELPLTLRAGAGYRSPSRLFGLAADMVWVRDQELEGRFGGEVWIWPEHFALRGGFNTANDVGQGYSVGAGFKWEDLAVDYAYVPYGELGDGHQVALTAQFGPARTQPGGTPRSAPATVPTSQRPAEVQPQPDYGRVEPPLSPVIASPLPPRVYVLPFSYQSGPQEMEWIGASIPEICYHKWRPAGAVSPYAEDARFTLEGNYWVVNGMLIVNATLKDEGWPVQTFQWRGEADKMFLLFDQLVARMTTELQSRGVGL